MDGHLNRTMAAAVRKAIFKRKKSTPASLVLHVGCATGVLSIAAAQARPEVADHVVACEKSSALIEVATARGTELGLVGICLCRRTCAT